MKKALLVAVGILALGLTLQAQTKRIAHRSHSGINATFNLLGTDNFGELFPLDFWNDLANKRDSLSTKPVGVYPYLYQPGEFAKETLKFWGKTILDSTVKRQQFGNPPVISPPRRPLDNKQK